VSREGFVSRDGEVHGSFAEQAHLLYLGLNPDSVNANSSRNFSRR